METISKSFGIWLKERRQECGLTHIQLATQSGIAQAQLSKIENNKAEITLFALARLLHALNLSVLSLFSEGIIDLKDRSITVKNLDLLEQISQKG